MKNEKAGLSCCAGPPLRKTISCPSSSMVMVAIFPTGPMPFERNSPSLRVQEDTQIEFGGFFCVVIKPEERRKLVHGCNVTSRGLLRSQRVHGVRLRGTPGRG